MLDLQAEMKLPYLFISNDMAVEERVSHRVAVMYLGEIVEIGPRSAVFENPVHPYTRRLLAAVPVRDPGNVIWPRSWPRQRSRVRCDHPTTSRPSALLGKSRPVTRSRYGERSGSACDRPLIADWRSYFGICG